MKKEPIKTPFLHKSKDSDYMDSIAIFKLILRFVNDTSLSPKREQALADYIIHKVYFFYYYYYNDQLYLYVNWL